MTEIKYEANIMGYKNLQIKGVRNHIAVTSDGREWELPLHPHTIYEKEDGCAYYQDRINGEEMIMEETLESISKRQEWYTEVMQIIDEYKKENPELQIWVLELGERIKIVNEDGRQTSRVRRFIKEKLGNYPVFN